MEVDYKSLAIIAKPLAPGKTVKRIFKTVKKSAKDKSLKRGVKEVVKAIRKGAKGIVIMAGDISPIDVLTHVPVMCEEAGIPYAFVPSKVELGQAGCTRRPTCCVMVPVPKADAAELRKYYDKCIKELKALQSS